MIDGEDLMDYDELLEGCESEIETHLLRSLYPELYPDAQKEIQAQYMIDYYDFAFPDAKIAIYCDGYEFHSERDSFQTGSNRGGYSYGAVLSCVSPGQRL